jgi:hypothetical protein
VNRFVTRGRLGGHTAGGLSEERSGQCHSSYAALLTTEPLQAGRMNTTVSQRLHRQLNLGQHNLGNGG